jgi:hypothetical protein
MEEINPKIITAVESVKNEIMILKQSLHFSMVANDKTHNASDSGSMFSFHSLFLQTIGYWIGLLDGNTFQKPVLPTSEQRAFNKITSQIKNIASYNSDSKPILYSMLFKYSQQHPFDMGEKKEISD